jgi:hypothetical protein
MHFEGLEVELVVEYMLCLLRTCEVLSSIPSTKKKKKKEEKKKEKCILV